MLQVEFTPVQETRARRVIEDTTNVGYGLSPGWIDPNQLRIFDEELTGWPEVNTQIRYDDILDLPPHTAALIAGLGTMGLQNGLTPKQVIVVDQVCGESGRGHFDKGATVSLSVALQPSRIQILRPGNPSEGIPEMDENGVFSLSRAHVIKTPPGTLTGYAGTKLSPKTAYHQVDNPSPTMGRKSIAIAFQ